MFALRPSGEPDEGLLAFQLFLRCGNEFVAQVHMYTLLHTRVDNHILCPDRDDAHLHILQISKQNHDYFQLLNRPIGYHEHWLQRQGLRAVSLPGQHANESLSLNVLCLWN